MTETASFGMPGKEGHDSRRFYARKLYAEAPEEWGEEPVVEGEDALLLADARHLPIPDNSVHLMVTSPPYNDGKEYDEDLTLDEYYGLLGDAMTEVFRVLVPGGRVCLNIANMGRKPYIPYHAHVIEAMLEIGFIMRGEVIWNKAASAGSSTAWGSWRSAKNPTLRDVHEYILIFSKGRYDRRKGASDITPEEFMDYTKSVWTFPTVSAKRIGHPAPFPEELAKRCIKLYTYPNDVVLDPFMGSGQTCLAAARHGRYYVGADIKADYVELARKRLRDEGFL